VAKDEQQEQETQGKEYPGQLADYAELRGLRKEAQANNDPSTPALMVAEQLAGLAYILDGIRYSARRR